MVIITKFRCSFVATTLQRRAIAFCSARASEVDMTDKVLSITGIMLNLQQIQLPLVSSQSQQVNPANATSRVSNIVIDKVKPQQNQDAKPDASKGNEKAGKKDVKTNKSATPNVNQ